MLSLPLRDVLGVSPHIGIISLQSWLGHAGYIWPSFWAFGGLIPGPAPVRTHTVAACGVPEVLTGIKGSFDSPTCAEHKWCARHRSTQVKMILCCHWSGRVGQGGEQGGVSRRQGTCIPAKYQGPSPNLHLGIYMILSLYH